MGKFLLSTLLLLTTAFASTAETAYELKFGKDYNSKGVSAYTNTTTFNVKVNNVEFVKMNAFNNANNDASWNFVRCGSKNAPSNALITTINSVPEAISQIVINAKRNKSGTLDNTKSAKLLVSKSSDFTSPDASYDLNFNELTTSASDITINLNSAATDLFYRISIEMDKTTNNGWLQINTVTFNVDDSNPDLLPADVAFPQNAYTFSIGESFESPVATKATTAELVYSSDNEEVATINASTGELTLKSEGTAVITAKAEENTEYNAGSASYTLTVIDPSIKIILNAPFTDSIDNLTLEGDGADKVWTYGGAAYGLKGTAYKINPAPTAPCYAVTPVINLAGYSEIKTTFKQAANYFDNTSNFQADCQIMIREVATEEWTPIEIAGLPDGKSWTFVDSSIDLNSYAGKSIQIGFCYTNGKTGTWEIKDLLIKGKYTPVAPAVPEILINGKEVTDLNSTENGTVSFVVADGTEVYYKVTNTSEAMLTAEDDYTKYETPFQIQIGQSVSYYAQSISDPTLRSEVTKATATVPTGVAEIEAAGAGEVRWFDMQGREVKGQPEKGIYVRVVNGKASKVAL